MIPACIESCLDVRRKQVRYTDERMLRGEG